MPPSATDEDVRGTARDADGSGTAKVVAGVEDAIRQIGVLVDVRAERARLRLRRTLARLQVALCIGAAMFLFAATGAVLVVIGTVAALRDAFADRPGVGDLVAGSLLLAGPLAWGIVRSVRKERAELNRLEAKFGEPAGSGRCDTHAQPITQR